MAKVFSRQKRHPFAAEQPKMEVETAPPYQSVTMEEWNNMKEQPPPVTKEVKAAPSSPARSKSTSNSTLDEEDPAGDFGLSCSGLLGEEVLLDTGFGSFARNALEATAESLRKLSEVVVKPIHKDEPVEHDNVILVDHDDILKENERLKRENTWLQEENESLRGGTYDEEDILSKQQSV